MKSLQLTEFGKPLQWKEYETPQPQGREVLLRVAACGVCHSDLHIWEGYYELGGDERIYVKERGVDLPLTLGHEVVGEVEAVGPDATGGGTRRQAADLPVGRLRNLQILSLRPAPDVFQTPKPRRVHQRRLRQPCAGARFAVSAEHRRPSR